MGTNYYLRPKKFEKLTILNKNLELALDTLKDDYLANVSSLIREAEKELQTFMRSFIQMKMDMIG